MARALVENAGSSLTAERTDLPPIVRDLLFSPAFRALLELIGDEIEARVWAWFRAHENDVIFERRVLLWKIRVRVAHLRPVLDAILDEAQPDDIAIETS